MNKILSFMSLCRKAGKLKMGFDSVEKSLESASLVLFSSDISPKTRERMKQKAEGFKVPTVEIPFEEAEIHRVIGKPLSVMAVTDKGFSDALIKKLQEFKTQNDISKEDSSL